jgi:hypothetical protein
MPFPKIKKFLFFERFDIQDGNIVKFYLLKKFFRTILFSTCFVVRTKLFTLK